MTALLTHSVVVCTRNRPVELETCLRSLGGQSRTPDLVLVVDSSDSEVSERVVDRLASSNIVPRLVWAPAAPGLTHQRNAGVARCDTEVIHFVDDDVICEPDYLAGIMAMFESDPSQRLLGVGGVITNIDPPEVTRRRELLGLTSRRQGVVLPSGCNTAVYDIASPLPVDWLSGCCMSYRRSAFDTLCFDESLSGYGLGEDLDFSYRLRQRGELVVTPNARLAHLQSPLSRFAEEEYITEEIVARSLRVRTRVGVLRMRAFWVSIIAQLIGQASDGFVRHSAAGRRRFRATAKGAILALRAQAQTAGR